MTIIHEESASNFEPSYLFRIFRIEIIFWKMSIYNFIKGNPFIRILSSF